mmetsp:Transcript_5594/g.4802  ORF Transcript_5594/g.4802 Transcript_5594/m.4802 type:complete len:159 (+) Transcript_5594:2-478(+)
MNSVPVHTTFSVHQMEDNQIEEKDQTVFSVKVVEEDIIDDTPKGKHTELNGGEDDELEEGTFEEYEFGTDELPSRTKIFGGSILKQNAVVCGLEKEKQKLDFEPKPELAGTEKYFESPLRNKEPEVEYEDSTIARETHPSEGEEEKNPEMDYEKYSIK